MKALSEKPGGAGAARAAALSAGGLDRESARLAKAGVPEPAQRHRSKSEIALAELDPVLGAEVRFGVVLADAAYGSSSGFRHALSQRGLTWAVGIPRTQKVYSLEVGPTWPVAPRGRPRQRPVPDIRPVAAQRPS